MRIAVVGSINIDQTVIADRIPHKGETLAGHDLRYIPGGKGANQAVAMARLGAETAMFGCVGDDENGRKRTGNLRELPSSRSERMTTPSSWWPAPTAEWTGRM